MSDDIVFEGKTLGEIFKDIYDNTDDRRSKIESMILKLSGLIKTPEDAAVLAPIIANLLEISIKNNDQIVKVAQIAQRAIAIGKKAGGGPEWLMSDEDKINLIQNVKDLQDDVKSAEDEIANLSVK